MAANITDLIFDDGAELEMVIGSSSTVIRVLALDFQENGFMYEYEEVELGQTIRRRVFRPYATQFRITQTL